MAQKPTRASNNRLLKIIDQSRGLINFNKKDDEPTVVVQSKADLISSDRRSKILSGSTELFKQDSRQRSRNPNSILGLISTSYDQVSRKQADNKRILDLVPDVKKAARLMVASIFAPNDLSRQEVSIRFNLEGVSEDVTTPLDKYATKFFQDKLKLKTNAPDWVYTFGYETGSVIFAVLPLQEFEKLHEEAYIGVESFTKHVIDPLGKESIFGFGDSNSVNDLRLEYQGLESFVDDISLATLNGKDKPTNNDIKTKLIEAFIGTEKLNLTDNPSLLQVKHETSFKRKKNVRTKLEKKFKTPTHQPIVQIDTPTGNVIHNGNDNPMVIKLPPESVTVIHTPGEPEDHQGYLVLLDITGNPINAASQEEDMLNSANNYSKAKSSIFSQIYSSYGIENTSQTQLNRQTMEHLYSGIITKHITQRLGKAGYNSVEIPDIDNAMKHLFSRMLADKQTRILFLPKELVTYMTFETDENGYGVSKLEGIKFSLGMKMAVQVSRVLATIKAATDKRKINIKIDDNMMEQPEAFIENVIQQYIQKSVISFSTDPGYIQSQIASKSFSVKTEGVPGMENFTVENEADTGSSSRDFDSSMMEYLDKSIINGLDIPAATMNALNEDEYARSVTTTNLFFAMQVSIYQDIVISLISEFIRTFGRYSGEFYEGLCKLRPELKVDSTKQVSTNEDNPDEDDKEKRLPDEYNWSYLIEHMNISLPKPSIAPSKAQFESLDSMTTAIAGMMNALFPDDLAGSDDKLKPAIALIRARFSAMNIRSYLENAGVGNITIPEGNFSSEMTDITQLHSGLANIAAMMKEQADLTGNNSNPDQPDAVSGY